MLSLTSAVKRYISTFGPPLYNTPPPGHCPPPSRSETKWALQTCELKLMSWKVFSVSALQRLTDHWLRPRTSFPSPKLATDLKGSWKKRERTADAVAFQDWNLRSVMWSMWDVIFLRHFFLQSRNGNEIFLSVTAGWVLFQYHSSYMRGQKKKKLSTGLFFGKNIVCERCN